jgi:hypothetical protein
MNGDKGVHIWDISMEIAEKSPQQQFVGNPTMSAVIGL